MEFKSIVAKHSWPSPTTGGGERKTRFKAERPPRVEGKNLENRTVPGCRRLKSLHVNGQRCKTWARGPETVKPLFKEAKGRRKEGGEREWRKRGRHMLPDKDAPNLRGIGLAFDGGRGTGDVPQ